MSKNKIRRYNPKIEKSLFNHTDAKKDKNIALL